MSSARYQVQTFTFFIRQPILILVREVSKHKCPHNCLNYGIIPKKRKTKETTVEQVYWEQVKT